MLRLVHWFKREDSNGDLLPGATLNILTFNHKDCSISSRKPCWKITPMFAWYDAWIGVYIDRDKRKVYVFPFPCFGFCFYWG